MTPVHYTTSDLYLAAYLMYRGAEVMGITKISNFCSTITLCHRKILKLVNEYNSNRPIKFSPRAYAEQRNSLKALIKSQPLA